MNYHLRRDSQETVWEQVWEEEEDKEGEAQGATVRTVDCEEDLSRTSLAGVR